MQDTTQAGRRAALAAMLMGGMAAASSAARAQEAPAPLAPDVKLVLPRTEFVYESLVDLLPSMPLGMGPLGERRMVPITGGQFAGPRMRGRVLPGGADRQLVRRDGARLLHATYELQTDDGAVISVDNQVLVKDLVEGGRYALSTVALTAPDGPYGWLNDAVYVGTLHSKQPLPQVLIRVYRVVA